MNEYITEDCVVFCKTKEKWGGLSNMAAGFPITLDATVYRTSEHLYQACRFPDNPEVRQAIVAQASPMAAKMTAKASLALTRPDWDAIRIEVMWWVICLKRLQNGSFYDLLLETGDRQIVELSYRDDFWGAKENGGILIGQNVLGQLLMTLRDIETLTEDMYGAWL